MKLGAFSILLDITQSWSKETIKSLLKVQNRVSSMMILKVTIWHVVFLAAPCLWPYRLHPACGLTGCTLPVALPAAPCLWPYRLHPACGLTGCTLPVALPAAPCLWPYRLHPACGLTGCTLPVALPAAPCLWSYRLHPASSSLSRFGNCFFYRFMMLQINFRATDRRVIPS